MNSLLASYGSGSDSEDEEAKPKKNVSFKEPLTSPIEDPLPHLQYEYLTSAPLSPTSKRLHSPEPGEGDSTSTAVEGPGGSGIEGVGEIISDTYRAKWEKEQAPKPPPAKSSKITGPVKIRLPELDTGEDSEEDEDDGGMVVKEKKTNEFSVKLLNMLPAPKSQSHGKLLLPKVKPKPKNQFLPEGESSDFVVPLKKPDLGFLPAKPVELPLGDEEPYKQGPSSSSQAQEEEEEAGPSSSGDFLGLSDDHEVEDQYDEPKPGPSITAADLHPSQKYNMAAEGSETFVPEEDEAELEERAQDLIYKHNYEKFGIKKEDAQKATIVDANVSAMMGTKQEIHANLLKNLSYKPKMSQKEQKAMDAEGPGMAAKRKHQITYLAHMAKVREDDLQDQWSQAKYDRNQSRMKYGFM